MADQRLTVAEIRTAVDRLIRRGVLANPQNVRTGEPHLVIDVDDHVSDEQISGGRVRVVLRSRRELKLLAQALDDESET